jgi:hypothetical protein
MTAHVAFWLFADVTRGSSERPLSCRPAPVSSRLMSAPVMAASDPQATIISLRRLPNAVRSSPFQMQLQARQQEPLCQSRKGANMNLCLREDPTVENDAVASCKISTYLRAQVCPDRVNVMPTLRQI